MVATSIQFGGEETLRREVEFDGIEAVLHVRVAGEKSLVPISGTVTDAAGRPVAGANVVIVPSGGSYVPEPFGSRPRRRPIKTVHLPLFPCLPASTAFT